MIKHPIDDSICLSDEDKHIFKHAHTTNDIHHLINMSIFSTNGVYKQNGKYLTFESNIDSNIYYISENGLFVDEHKKILFYSRYYLGLFEHYIQEIDNIINLINDIDLTIHEDIGSNIVSIQRWFETYGHFTDELFNIADYIHINNINHKPLLDYPTTDKPHFKANTNYNFIDNLLFNKHSINAYTLNKNKVLKLQNLVLIYNFIIASTFHSFPIIIRDKILHSITTPTNILTKSTHIMITRGKALHLPRNLYNQSEIENKLSDNNYNIINPELLSLPDFINSIKHADKVFITWGGALTNLIYLKPNTQVYILKSKSYEREYITLFNKIIQTYNLNIQVLIHENNILPLSLIDSVL
jgi:hypothetical protein